MTRSKNKHHGTQMPPANRAHSNTGICRRDPKSSETRVSINS